MYFDVHKNYRLIIQGICFWKTRVNASRSSYELLVKVQARFDAILFWRSVEYINRWKIKWRVSESIIVKVSKYKRNHKRLVHYFFISKDEELGRLLYKYQFLG